MSAYQEPFAAFALSQLRSNIGWRKETQTIEMGPILVYVLRQRAVHHVVGDHRLVVVKPSTSWYTKCAQQSHRIGNKQTLADRPGI